jgi:Mrp family chromosome partitioning ATPase
MMPAFGRFTADLAASELLASARFGQMLAALKMHFEVIVVDAPPLLPVVDARIVADHADQIAMTMLWRRTPKQLAKRAIKTLGPNAAKIAGVMVNQVDPAELRDTLGYGGVPYGTGGPGQLPRAA